MFNKIFRRGKTTKEDAAPIPSYKNSLKSPVDYEYGQKNFNLNNKTPYSTSSNTTGSNKYATTNDFAPSSWSTYDPNKYEPSPVNRTQNVYTAPPQRNLPYNQPIGNSREYEKPYQQFSVGSPNQSHQYPPSYKPNNLGYSNKPDSTAGDRSPYISLGSTYSQNRPSYEQFKRDGSINRTSNSQPGTPTPSRRETYDTSPYDNRNTYVSTPNRTFESPQRDTNFNRSTFSPPNNVNSANRYGARVYESPFRENVNKSNLGTYNSSNYPPDIPTRNLTSSFNQTPYNPAQESAKYDSNRNAYNSNLGNSAKTNYNDSNFSVLKPSFNANTLTNASAKPLSPEPGKYIPYAVRKALKESQQAQQQAQPANNDNVRDAYHNYNQSSSNNAPTSKYPTTPYKPVYETPGISTNKTKSPYSNIEQSPYIELSNSTVGKRNFESPASRITSPPITNNNSKLYGQKSFNEPPDLPPKNPALQNRVTDLNRTFTPTANLSQSTTPSNSGYYNIDSSDKKSTYIPFSNQTSYSPSIKSPTPSQDYINLSANPKPFSHPQIQTEIPNTAKHIYGVSNNTYTTTNPSSSNQYNNQFQNAEPSKSYLNSTNITSTNAYNNSIPSSFNDTATNSNSAHLSNNIFLNENKFNKNNSDSRSTYEPQKNLYDTNQSYVQTPQYNYRSGEQTPTTQTNTNAFDDWLPKSISNLNENSSYGSTRNESELWKREKNNANASDFSSTAFGTVPSKLNAGNYFNDKNNSIQHNLNNDSSIKKDINFDRYSIPEQQIQPEKSLKSSLNNRTNQKPPLPLSSSLSSASFSVASPLLEAASISAAAANLSCQPENELDDYESESENLSSSEQINGVTSEETTKSKSPKKAVRFFNPIDKSREILNDIMAKGRNRGHHNKHRNNNNKNSNQKSNNNNKTESKTPLIVQNEVNVDIKNLQNSNSASETNNNLKNNKSIKSEIISETDSINPIGYQISKSKNSRDIVNKLQNTRAKLASPEDDESDNNFSVHGINSATNNNNHRNKFDDDTTDNTDTETLDETFEDDESTFSSKNTASDERNTENLVKSSSTSQNEIRNSKSACDNKFNNTESSVVGKSSAKNFQQQKQEKPSIQQVYHQQTILQNSNLPSVNENNFDRDIRSSVRVDNTETQSSSRKKSSDTDFFANLKKHQGNDKNAEQIEKIEKLSELTECDRDSFIKTQSSMGQNQTKTSAKPSPTAKPESPRLIRSRSSSPPNRTVNKPTQLHSNDYAEIYKCSSQRDREPVIEEPLSPTTPLSPTESCDQFYDLTHDNNTTTSNSNNSAPPLPKVTVADYSEDSNNASIEPDIFYDFETVTTDFGNGKNLSKSPPKYPPPPPAPSAQFKSRSASPIDIVTLEDIEEEEDEEDEWHFIDDNGNDNNSNSVQQKQKQQQQQQQQQQDSTPKTQNYLSSPTLNRRNISSSSTSNKTSSPILTRKSPTPQRSTFDYENYSDGLNTPDSGIGGATTPISSSTIHSVTSTTTANSSSTHNSNKVLVINSCDLVNDTDDIELLQSHQKQISNNYYNNTNINTVNFSDTNTFIENVTSEHSIINNSTSIVIDSISLPDVVIESKPKDTESQNNSSSTLLNVHNNNDYVLNVSKSKSEGNVHFIPIHVEGREKPKIEIVEETTEFSGSNNNNNSITDNFNINTFNINDGFIEDISNQNNNSNNNFNISNSDNNNNYNINNDNNNNNNITVIKTQDTDNKKYKSENNQSSNNSYTVPLNSTSKNETTNKSKNNNEDYQELENELQEELKRTKDEKQKKEEELKRELVNQEARFNAQLQEAQRNASSAQERAHELQMKIDQLEQDISLKSWHIERLNGEIQAIQKEHTSVRKRLQTIEDEKERLRKKSLDDEDEFNIKYENLEDKYKELEEKYEKLRQLGTSLQTQLAHAKVQADELQIEKEKLCEEKDAELKQLQELLDKAIQERKELEIKWQKEFELLRNHNQEHEEQLLTDCEFQLRSMQKKCKEKIEAAEKAKQEVLERNEELEEKVAECEEYSERLKNLQAEVRQLRGLTNEQRESITHMHIQIEELRTDLEAANLDLENKIEEVRKIKLYCDNTLLFKDREMIQKIDEATREVATIWEERLLTEMTRLTNELEAVHSEERLSDMNKLQTEHIEELKVLTNRYTSNEEELRKELEEVSEKLQKKTSQYLELRDKSDTEILTTRITLDRADREYQQAMNRELDKKMELEDKLRKEFEKERDEMEAEFQIRIEEVKDNFKKDMANQTQEIAQRHRKQLEQQWDQLVAEKEDALQTLEKRHKIKLEDQENRLRNLEAQHKRDMKDLKSAYDLDRSALQNRDIHNSQEIEQLHRKCRCLTNLFEEMRLRYERREPRPEDLREIDELRARCDSQERDLCELTERLREMQIQMEEIQATTTEYQEQQQQRSRKKPVRKPPPKQIPISCDVIYEEENEETESLEDTTDLTTNGFNGENNNDSIHQNSTASTNQKTDDTVNNNSKEEEEDDEEEDEEEDN